MGKVSKKVLFVLLIGALLIPMFVGCDDGGGEPVDLVAVAKSAFLTALDGKIGDIDTDVATVTVDGQDFEVTFTPGKSSNDIKIAAHSFFDAIILLAPSAKLKINNVATEYGSGDKGALKVALIDFLYTGNSAKIDPATLPYEASVTYNSQTFQLKGTVTFKAIPDLT